MTQRRFDDSSFIKTSFLVSKNNKNQLQEKSKYIETGTFLESELLSTINSEKFQEK